MPARPRPLLFILLAITAATASAQSLTGRIVEDSTGDPIAGAELKIHQPGLRELLADLDTDRSGRFTTPDLQPGDYTIDIVKPNFITASFPVHIPSRALKLRLIHYAVMDGRVANTSGQPVAGVVRANGGQTIGATRVTVLTRQAGPDSEFRSLRDTAVDDNGHFRFFDLPPGQYQLAISYYGVSEGSGFQFYPDNTNPRIFTVAGGETYNDLNFLVIPTTSYKVSGSVILPAAKQNFSLALVAPNHPILPLAIALTKPDGSFEFSKIAPGEYDLLAAGPTNGYGAFESTLTKEPVFGRMRIQVGGSDLTGLSVPVDVTRSLTVTLRPHNAATFAAACPQTATVTLKSLDPWGIMFNLTSPVSTKATTIANLPPGRFRIDVSELGVGCFQANHPVVDLSREPTPANVELAAAGSIHGILNTGGRQSESWAILLIDPDSTDAAVTQLALPAPDGHFSFETLHPGRYRIAAQLAAEGSRTRWLTDLSHMTEINVAAGEASNVALTPAVQNQEGIQ